MENKLYVSPSPHIHGRDSISKNMYGVLIALVPAFLVSLYFFGLGALIVTAVSVFFCRYPTSSFRKSVSRWALT